MEQKEILFSKSMTADKRNEDFAYFRNNLFDSRHGGLYPSHQFSAIDIGINASKQVMFIDAIASSTPSTTIFPRRIIVQNGADLELYVEGTTTPFATLAGATFVGAVTANEVINVCVLQGGVHKMVFIFLIGAPQTVLLTNNITGNIPLRYGVFDGLYIYWATNTSNSPIYRTASQSSVPTQVFADVGGNIDALETFNEQIIVCDETWNNINIFFWGKSSSSLYDKRIIVKNSRFLAIGQVEGRLILVHTVGNSTNIKERAGEIVVSAYDGEKFVRINSINAGNNTVSRASPYKANYAIGNGVIVLGIDNNYNQKSQIYQNHLLKIYPDGRIETLWQSSVTSLVPYSIHMGMTLLHFLLTTLTEIHRSKVF